MAAPGEVCAILVAHESGGRLDAAVASVLAQSYASLRLVVVTVGAVRSPAGVDVVEAQQGSGFAAAVAAGLAHAGDAGLILLLHDDVVLEPDAVEHLVARATAAPEADVVGAKLVEYDAPEILQEVGAAVDRLGRRRAAVEPGELDQGQYDGVSDVVACSAACLLVRRASLDARGLDPDAWPLYEDLDLCWRVRAAGGRVVVEPAARVRHAADLSRGARGTSAAALWSAVERGRLRFILRNFGAAGIALVLPQYAAGALVSLAGALVRGRLWQARATLRAWRQVLSELPKIWRARRSSGPRSVPDHEILTLASRQVAHTRRLARVSAAGRVADRIRSVERRAVAVVASPVTIGAVVAITVVTASLRGVLAADAFTLGELRPLPPFANALGAFVARTRSEGLDAFAPASPGLLVLSVVRLVPRVSAATAERLWILGPLLASAFGGRRLGAALGLDESGRRWMAIATAVNPVTLFLAREGLVGPLVMWTVTTFLATGVLRGAAPGRRGAAATAVGWAVAVAIHPPSLAWLLFLGAAAAAGTSGDGRARARARRIAAGAAGAFACCLPWSLTWFGASSPLVGRLPGFVPSARGGLETASLGGGWPVLLAVAVVPAAVVAVRPTRLAASIAGLAAVTWAAGAAGAVPSQTALCGAGWCVLFLAGSASPFVRDELRRSALGRGHVAVIAAGSLVTGAWVAGAALSVVDGADAHAVGIVPPAQRDGGRVMWVLPTAGGDLVWTTSGFAAEIASFPVQAGPAERLVARTLTAARAGSTHRLGTVLALAGVSDVVVLGTRDDDLSDALASQADLSILDAQRAGTIIRNEVWAGPALLLRAPPRRPLTPAGLADLAAGFAPATVSSRGGELEVTPPSGPGVLYLAQGPRPGWHVGSATAHPAAFGVWVRIASAERVRASPPGRLVRPALAVPLAAILALLLLAMSSGSSERSVWPVQPSRAPRILVLLPALGLAGAVWLAWTDPPTPSAAGRLSSAASCPPIGEGPTQHVAIVNPWDAAVRYVVRPSITGRPRSEGVLASHARGTIEVDPKAGAIVESFGPPLVSAAIVAAPDARDAAACGSARRTTMFAEGGRSATGASTSLRSAYVLYNPYPERARVTFRFSTPDETISPPALQDVVVEPGSARAVDPESQLDPQPSLGAEITVWKGRAVVARRMRRAGQLSWSLGTSPVSDGVFPRAATASAETTIVAMNPTDVAARVRLESSGPSGSIPALAFDVPATGRESFPLSGPAANQGDLVVRVRAEPPVAVEAVVVTKDRTSVAVLPPASPRTRWAIPAAEGRTLLIANTGRTASRVTVARLGAGPSIPGVTVPPGRVGVVTLEGADAFGVLVVAHDPVVVSAVGAAGSLAGVPVDNV